jgi:hypothetical protein
MLLYKIQDPFQFVKENKDSFDFTDYPEERELYDKSNKKVIGTFLKRINKTND